MATPVLAQRLGGWPACFIFFAGLGIVWAVSLLLLLADLTSVLKLVPYDKSVMLVNQNVIKGLHDMSCAMWA